MLGCFVESAGAFRDPEQHGATKANIWGESLRSRHLRRFIVGSSALGT